MKTALKIIVDSNTDKVALKLKVLSNLFNIIPVNDTLRYDVYMGVLTYADKAEELERLSSHWQSLEAWAREWTVSDESVRALLLRVNELLINRGQM